jgi:hypothetical protein
VKLPAPKPPAPARSPAVRAGAFTALAARLRGRSLLAPALACALAALPVVALRGFTVDDAWIPARYAAHLAGGDGYRFNAGFPSTDGVTPLPWAPLLSLLSLPWGGDIMAAWHAARALGAASWLLGAALLGAAVRDVGGRRARYVALLPLGLSAPLGAWAVAGLETGLVAGLAAASAACVVFASRAAGPAPPGGDGASSDGPRCDLELVPQGIIRAWRLSLLGAGAVGLCAAFRPDALALAAVLGACHGRALGWRGGGKRLAALAAALAVGPWALVAAARLAAFGRPFPLAVLAKPSDFSHGAAYVAAGLLLAGPPALCLAPLGLARDDGRARWLLGAAAAQALSVLLAGGDWMPLSRLLVPAMPPLIVAAALLASRAPLWATAARASLAAAGMLFAWSRAGLAARTVVDTRAALIAPARAALSGARSVASLDAGWVGAALWPGQARLVDLAGLTDPGIAVLPGGHTSKRVTAAMLDARGVEALVLLRRSGCDGECVRDDGGPFERAVEERVAGEVWVRESFAPVAVIASGPLTYVVLRRR